MTESSVVARAVTIAENLANDDQVIQARLQAPLPDALLSWKPGPLRKDKRAVFFPYIDDAFYRDRLDAVLGMTQWSETYTGDDKLTECRVSLRFPSGKIVDGIGIGAFTSRDDKEDDSEKGTRTMAFRDACKHLGICGRDTDGAQTVPVLCVTWTDSQGKERISAPAEPLSRLLLRHSGQSGFATPAYIRSVVLLTEDPMASRYLDVAESFVGQEQKESTSQPRNFQSPPKEQSVAAPTGDYRDSANITFPYGKKHNGQKLTEIPTGYLEWAGANMDAFKPGNRNYNEFLVMAVAYYLEQKEQEANGQSDAAEPEQEGPDAMEFFDGTDVPEGL